MENLTDIIKSYTNANGKMNKNKKNNNFWYYKKIPNALEELIDLQIVGSELNFYKIKIIMTKYHQESKEIENLHNFEKHQRHFSIILPGNLDMIPSFKLLVRVGDFEVLLEKIGNLVLRPEQKNKINNFQFFLFEKLFKITHPIFERSNKVAYLLAPLFNVNGTYKIDWDLMKEENLTVENLNKAEFQDNDSLYNYVDSVLVPWYKDELQFYCVTSKTNLTPESLMEQNQEKTYKFHFKEKYKLDIKDSRQNLFKGKQIEKQLNYLNQKHDLKDSNKKEREGSLIELIPELCNKFFLPASLYIQAKFLPSIIHRINRLLLSFEIKDSYLAYIKSNSSNLFEKPIANYENQTNSSTKDFNYYYNMIDDKKGPDVFEILEAITLADSNDSIDLERQEVLGDSFLKYCSTVQIFCNFPNDNEGALTQTRSHLISNSYLNKVGNEKNLGNYLSGSIFRPKETWLPPSCSFDQAYSSLATKLNINFDLFKITNLKDELINNVDELENSICDEILKTKKTKFCPLTASANKYTYTHSKLTIKNIADSMESLIGSFYIHGGIESAINFMSMMDVKGYKAGDLSSYGNWAFTDHLKDYTIEDLKKTMPSYESLEIKINYKFKNPWFLVEALTHASSAKHNKTRSYERLEFLGDAILDFLVTNHIYKYSNAISPGDLTDLRSALVNNIIFGSLTVKHGFHKYLFHDSSSLQKAMDSFEEYQVGNKHTVTGHFVLINDFETGYGIEYDLPKTLGDIFESIAGAVFLDSGLSLEAVWNCFYPIMKKEIDMFSENIPKSPVRTIYELNLKIKKVERGLFCKRVKARIDINSTVMEIEVNDKIKKSFYGVGANKVTAKQAVAKVYLFYIPEDRIVAKNLKLLELNC